MRFSTKICCSTQGRGYSKVEHIARSIWGNRFSRDGLLAMLTFYGDESIDHPRNFTVVAGYVASVSRWQQFEVDWRIMLAKFDVPYLHMKQLAHFKKPFDKWEDKPNTRSRFLATAADIINCNVDHGVSVYIHQKDWEYVDADYELHEHLSSPYALAGRACIAEVNVARARRFQKDGIGISKAKDLEIEYIFHEDGPDVGGLMAAVKFPKPQFPTPIFKPSVDRESEKGVIQLQAADYLAYEMRKFVRDHARYRQGTRTVRKSLQALTGAKISRQFGTLEKLVDFWYWVSFRNPANQSVLRQAIRD